MVIERHDVLDPEGAKPIISGVTAFGSLVSSARHHLALLPVAQAA